MDKFVTRIPFSARSSPNAASCFHLSSRSTQNSCSTSATFSSQRHQDRLPDIGSVAEWFGASFLRRPWSQDWWFNSHLSLAVASLDKMLHENYLYLVESNNQQMEEIRSKTQAENLKTRATPKRIWNRPMHSASVAFSWQEKRNEEIKIC